MMKRCKKISWKDILLKISWQHPGHFLALQGWGIPAKPIICAHTWYLHTMHTCTPVPINPSPRNAANYISFNNMPQALKTVNKHAKSQHYRICQLLHARLKPNRSQLNAKRRGQTLLIMPKRIHWKHVRDQQIPKIMQSVEQWIEKQGWTSYSSSC